MEVLKYSIGVDVDMDKLQCEIVSLNIQLATTVITRRKFDNSTSGFKAFVLWVAKFCTAKKTPISIVMEATGVYHESFSFYLFEKEFKCSVLLPNKSKYYLKALGLKSKNDKIDASGLALMGSQMELEVWAPISEFIYEIRAILRHRESLICTRTALNNQLHANKYSRDSLKVVSDSLLSLIESLDKQINKAEKKAIELAKKDESFFKKLSEISASIKGLGILSCLTVVAEANGFILFKNQRQLTSYCGYDVVENSSGNRKGKTKISKSGNAHIRRVLHMPALNVVRFNTGKYRDFYQRIFLKSFIPMKGYVAVQRKLLCMIYTLWQKEEVFDENHKYFSQTVKR